MGYYVDIVAADVRFKVGTDPVELGKRLKKQMFDPVAIQKHGGGGSSNGSGQIIRHYSWVNTQEALAAKDVYEIMRLFLDEVVVEDDGTLNLCMNSKSGGEDQLFKALAPYIESGSYIEWHGEDDSCWKWKFNGQTMTVHVGRVIYDDDAEGVS